MTLKILAALLLLAGLFNNSYAAEGRPNVLFIAVDDLNCRIGCYGDKIVRTPNLDRLASRGVRFDRAYCQFPLCNATRSSVLSGRYPTTTGVLDNFTWLVLPNGNETLLPTRFEKSGYAVSLKGKIFHLDNTGFRPGDAFISKTDDSWLTPDERRQQQKEHPNPPAGFFLDARAMRPEAGRYTSANRYGLLPPNEAGTDVPIADAAIAELRRFAGGDAPFFLGVGFKKPHVPLLAPQEFLDLYAAADIPLPPDFDTAPRGGNGMPPEEFRGNRDLFSGRAFTRDEAREAIRCYYACISYMDRQLGRVLDELDRLDLAKNTVIALWGDHGWHLGEKGLWAKDTLFESSARGPLLIVDPRHAATAGKSSPRVVQYLDLYPTLLDLCGLPLPDYLEGVSLAPLLKNPNAPWDRPAFTVQTRGWSLGRSLRTERWRYTEWDADGKSRALFDHDADPHELRNLAHDPAHAKTVTALQQQLRESKVGQSMRRDGSAAAPALHPVKTHADIEFARPGGVPLLMDIHLPTDVKKPPLVVFIHGGGWRQGDRKKNKLDWLPAHGFAVASIEYRFSQEAVFPAQIHDCKGALRWLRAHADDYGYDASRVIVAGASSGGHLAALLGLTTDMAELEGDTAGHPGQSNRVLGILDFYGATDLIARAALQPKECEEPGGKVYRLLGGKVSEKTALARLASPVTHVTPDDPPLLILHGELDDTVPVSQSELLRDRYHAAGLEAQLHIKPGAGHGWTKSDAKERELVLTTLKRWLEKK